MAMIAKIQPDDGASVSAEIAAGGGMPLIELARQQQTAPSTCFRWARKALPDGRGGRVFLEAVRRGKKWLTSSAAIARFFARLEHSVTPTPTIRTASKRERDSARAKQALNEEYGI